jgi:hypothetical protein
MTLYIFIAIPLEERDLITHFGERYARYCRSVGGLMPRLKNRSPAEMADIDLSVFRDVTWWSWIAMIALLVMRFAYDLTPAVHAGIALCGGLAVLDLIARSRAGEQRCAMSVQIRVCYVALLVVGLLPGMAWLHAVQIAGTTARVLVGYCLLERELRLMPWNYPGRLTLAGAWEVLTAPPGAGGLITLGSAPSPC